MPIHPHELPFASEMLAETGALFRGACRDIAGKPPAGENTASWMPPSNGCQRFGMVLSMENPRIVPLSLNRNPGQASENIDCEFGEEFLAKASAFMENIGKGVDESSASRNPGWTYERLSRRMAIMHGSDMRLRHAVEGGLKDIKSEGKTARMAMNGTFNPDGTLTLSVISRIDGPEERKGRNMVLASLNGPAPKSMEEYSELLRKVMDDAFPAFNYKFARLKDADYMLQTVSERDARNAILREEAERHGRKSAARPEEPLKSPFDQPWGAEAKKIADNSLEAFFEACASRYGLPRLSSGKSLEFPLSRDGIGVVNREAARIGGSGDMAAAASRTAKEIDEARVRSVAEVIAKKYGASVQETAREAWKVMGGAHSRNRPAAETAAIVRTMENPVLSFSPRFEARGNRMRIYFNCEVSGKHVPENVRKDVAAAENGLHECDLPKSAKEFEAALSQAMKKFARAVDPGLCLEKGEKSAQHCRLC